MEVNTANNKMSLSMLPATEEAGEFLFVSGGRWLTGMNCLCLAIFSCCCMQEAATYEVCVFFAYSMHDEIWQHRLLCSPVCFLPFWLSPPQSRSRVMRTSNQQIHKSFLGNLRITLLTFDGILCEMR